MKDLLIKMASIANELDLIGLEKEANQVTVDMLKLAQHYGADYNQPKSMYDKRRYTSSNYLMDSYLRKAKKQNMSINQLYEMVKNEASAKIANDLIAILKEAGYTDPAQKVPNNFSISSVGPTQGLYESQTKKQQGMFEARGNKIKSSPDEIEKTLEKYHATHTIRQMYDELFKQNKKILANDLAALLSLDGYNQANPVPSGLTSLTRSRAGMR